MNQKGGGPFHSGGPDKVQGWKLRDAAPEEDEAEFTDEEFEQTFKSNKALWETASVRGDVSEMWRLLEAVLAQCHRWHSPSFSRPLATNSQ